MERFIAQIWQEVLGLQRVGVHDNFFTDLSGHSLLATELVSRLRRLFQIEVPLASLFEGPTIAQLAVTVAALRQSHPDLREQPLVPTRRQERRARISAEGKLEMPDELRAELSKTAS
jgi:acyl carrier protein